MTKAHAAFRLYEGPEALEKEGVGDFHAAHEHVWSSVYLSAAHTTAVGGCLTRWQAMHMYAVCTVRTKDARRPAFFLAIYGSHPEKETTALELLL